MSKHTTNYENAFIQVSPDSAAMVGTSPTRAGTIAAMQYERLINAPYQITSDELLFGIYADRRGLSQKEWDAEKVAFFAKGQPCLRVSPLVKTFGWGVHHDEKGRVAIYPVEGDRYAQFVADPNIENIKGMRNKRKGS
ncbi:DUF6157 family protein [uncultured Maritalea sp.]|uniref:DUF6157 family protein n=1 Tax=uncultured Maritalea sp. TaxID=757249 RepID=UPI002624DC25|nr:DUF6157 family protein [uncultured Maritalea sp.]